MESARGLDDFIHHVSTARRAARLESAFAGGSSVSFKSIITYLTVQIARCGKRIRRTVLGGSIQAMQGIRQPQNSFFDGRFVYSRKSNLNSLLQVAGVAVSAERHDIDPSCTC